MKNHVIVSFEDASLSLAETLKAGDVTMQISMRVPRGRYIWWDNKGEPHICVLTYEERKAG